MTDEQIRERCSLYKDKLRDYGDEGVYLAEDSLSTLESLYREAMAEGLERAAVHLETEVVKSREFESKLIRKGNYDAASDIETQRRTEEAYSAWCRQEAARVKEGKT